MTPLVIGMVLGPTLEISLLQGLSITDGSSSTCFAGHQIAAVLIAVVLIMLPLPATRTYRSNASKV